MGLINPTLPVVGQPNSTEDSKILSALTTITNVINGNIDTANIATNGVATAEIADGAVTTAKIAANAVGQGQIAAGGVSTTQLAAGAVTDAKVTDVAASKLTGTFPNPSTFGTDIRGPGGALFINWSNTGGDAATGYINTYGTHFVHQGNGSASWDTSVAGQHQWINGAPAARSDVRLKRDVADLEGGLQTIESLRPVSFKWKPGNALGLDPNLQRIGFIAQEVQPHVPQAVMDASRVPDEDDQYLALAPSELIPHLVGAVKELSARVRELEAQVA